MKKIIFSAMVAIVAVGGASVSKGNGRAINAKQASSPGTTCTTNVSCHISTTPSCTINNVQFVGQDPNTGLCNRTLALD